MARTVRGKVERAFYDPENTMIVWSINVGDNVVDVVWEFEEFGPSFGIIGRVTVPLAEEFCERMIGREVNLLQDDPEQEEEK